MTFSGKELEESLYQAFISEQWGKVMDIDEWLLLILYKGGYLKVGKEYLFPYELYRMLSKIRQNIKDFQKANDVFEFIELFGNYNQFNYFEENSLK